MNLNADLISTELSEYSREAVRAKVIEKVNHHNRRLRIRRRIGLVAGVSAASVLMVAVYPIATSQSAYATWTPVPTLAQASVDNPQVRECVASLPNGPTESIGSSQLTPILAENRGKFTATLLGAGDSIALCIFDSENRSSARTLADPLPMGAQVSVLGNGGSLNAGNGARYIYGRANKAITDVMVRLSDGDSVQASVSNGYFLAWWPAGPAPLSLAAKDTADHTLADVDLS